MKKFFTIVVFLLVASVLSGCLVPDGVTDVALKDCGSDPKCFEEAAKTCEPAKITLIDEDELSIIGLYSEIRGPEGDNCVLYLRVTKLELETPGLPLDPSEQELFDQLQQGFKTLEGKDMLCTFPKEMISGEDLFSMVDPEESCTGSLITAIEQLQ